MSRFEAPLRQAKKRQYVRYVIGFIVCLSVFLSVFGVVLFSNGVRIEIMPPNVVARVEVVQGVAFTVGHSLYALSDTPHIMVSATGFRTVTEAVDFRHSVKVHRITLVALPGQLTATVTMPYSEATRWFLDGHDLGASATLTRKLEAGKYVLALDNPYYEEKSMPIHITKAGHLMLSIELTPVHGEIAIVSEPPGATLTIDGDIVGSTPVRTVKSGGRYHGTLSLAGYHDITDTIAVTRLDAMPQRRYFLEAEQATVRLTLIPDGGTLLHNGVHVNKKALLQVAADMPHQFTYQKPGYVTAKRTIQVALKEIAEVRFELIADVGTVEVSSTPQATLLVNGTEVGKTPQSLDLAAILQRLTFVRAGYVSVERTVRPSSQAIKKIHETLVTEADSLLRDAPRFYSHKAGGEMKLFVPNEKITLGAKRDEAGQRANELVRIVKLTRPFYAGLHEVTYGEFNQFERTPTGAAKQPVTSINWNDAARFCNWLSNEEGLQLFYTVSNGVVNGFNDKAQGYRLLSEAEWEWLARKSNKQKQTLFTWGNKQMIPHKTANVADKSAKANTKTYIASYQDGFAKSAPVGSFNKEPSGLFDMAGNVSEWTHDFYTVVIDDHSDVFVDPLGDQAGFSHVVKGANFRSATLTELRASFREGLIVGRDDIGFRIGRYL